MNFYQYIELGWDHIADPDAYDHILFIVAMCAMYKPKDWKKLLILVTAFTIGHCLTLALSALNVFRLDASLVEFLIPVTIVITAIGNVLPKKEYENKGWFSWNYVLVLFFGLIHGMGFSNYFRMLIGKKGDIIMPLFGFNIGVEIGQIIIVGVFLILSYICLNVLNFKFQNWKTFISGTAFGVAMILIKDSDFI